MANTNSKLRKALKPLKNPKTGWKNKFVAVIGKGDGTILTDVPGEVWVRDALSGQELRAHNSVVPNIGSLTNPLQVIVGTSIENPDILEIISTRKTFSAPPGSGLTHYHFAQHVYPGPDSGLFPRKQIGQLTVLVADAENFIVQVYGDAPRTATGIALIRNQQIDLSSYVPTSGAVYVNIESDDDGVLTPNDGTPFAAKELATNEDIPVPATGKYRIATIILFETMEYLLDEHITVPSLLEMPPGGGGGTWGSITGTLSDQTDLQTALDSAENDAKAYADGLVVGLWDDRGSYDASGGAYPSSGGSGTAGAILKGDVWTISVAGTLPTGQVAEVGDIVRALINTPGNTQANWAIQQNNIGYTAENSANKSTDVNTDQASNTKYPSVKAVYDWAVGLFLQIGNFSSALANAITLASAKNPPVGADSIPINDTEDSNALKRVTLTVLRAFFKLTYDAAYIASGGWNEVSESWSYASASTITIPSDGTTKYQKGIKIRFKQGGGYKYFVGKTIASTLITVFVNTDYTVANSAITDIAYSYIENPYGFPTSFNYTPTFNGLTVGSSTLYGKMEVKGLRVIQKAGFIAAGAFSITGSLNLTPLATPVALGTTQEFFGATTIRDTGTALYEGTVYYIGGNFYPQVSATGGAYAAPANVTSAVPMTFVATDELSMYCEYTY